MNCKELDFELDFIEIEDDYGNTEHYIVTALYAVEEKKYLSLVSAADGDVVSDDELQGHLYEYIEMEEDMFEMMEIPDDEEFNRIAAIIQAYEDSKR